MSARWRRDLHFFPLLLTWSLYFHLKSFHGKLLEKLTPEASIIWRVWDVAFREDVGLNVISRQALCWASWLFAGWRSSIHHSAFPASATARNVLATVLTFSSTFSNPPSLSSGSGPPFMHINQLLSFSPRNPGTREWWLSSDENTSLISMPICLI